MKRLIVVGLLVVGSLSWYLPNHLNSFFGLSKCDRVRQDLNAEQAIGFALWKKFDKHRDIYVIHGNKLTWAIVKDLLPEERLVEESDARIYGYIEENERCFTTKFNASNRTQLQNVEKRISSLDELILSLSKNSTYELDQKVSTDAYFAWRDFYTDYYDWEFGKKLSS